MPEEGSRREGKPRVLKLLRSITFQNLWWRRCCSHPFTDRLMKKGVVCIVPKSRSSGVKMQRQRRREMLWSHSKTSSLQFKRRSTASPIKSWARSTATQPVVPPIRLRMLSTLQSQLALLSRSRLKTAQRRRKQVRRPSRLRPKQSMQSWRKLKSW